MKKTLPYALALVLVLLVIAAHNRAIRPWMLDDAFISFRYAENWAAGHGPVFNPGERVEGYTTFLWVLLLAVGKAFGLRVVPLSQWLGAAFALGTVLLLLAAHRFSRSIPPMAGLAAALLAGTCGAFTPWPASGMEVMLFTFLLLLALLFHFHLAEKEQPKVPPLLLLGLLLALAALTRPEGLLLAGLVLAQRLWQGRREGRGRFFLPLAAFAAVYIPYFAWRLAYYGYLLPNTFYTKVGSSSEQVVRGVAYLKAFLSPALPLVLLALVPFVTLRWFRRHGRLWLLPLLLVLYGAYIVVVGGDVMPAYRFFTPLLPMLGIMAGIGLTAIPGPRKAAATAGTVLALAAVVFNLHAARHDWHIAHKIRLDQTAERGREVGIWLRIHARPGAVIATNTAGSIPYYSRLQTIDMLGLNDLHIAHRPIAELGRGVPGHEKGDGAYVLARRPDYIHMGSSLGSLVPDHGFLGDEELYALPLFHELYELKSVRLPSGRTLHIFQKRRPRG